MPTTEARASLAVLQSDMQKCGLEFLFCVLEYGLLCKSNRPCTCSAGKNATLKY